MHVRRQNRMSWFDPRQVKKQSFVETDYEIFSMVGLSLSLTQKGGCQFLEKECAQVLVNRLEELTCSGKV